MICVIGTWWVAVLINTSLGWRFMATNDLCNVDLVGCGAGKHLAGVEAHGHQRSVQCGSGWLRCW